MTRLPTPGQDAGQWGDILNDFLSTSHKTDGTLKDGSVGSAQLKDNAVTQASLADGAVTEATLSSAVQTKLNQTAPVTKVNNQTGDVTLTKTDVGLANVDNTSDSAKPVSTAQQAALDLKADATALTGKLDTSDLDAQTAAKITTEGSATQAALSSTYATVAQGAKADSAVQPTALGPLARRRGTRAVLFGDSHVEGTSGSGASDWRTNRNSPIGGAMFAWAIWLSNSRVQFWGNYGAGGERTDQVYARINSVLTSGGDLVLLQMGTNDSRQGVALSVTQGYYRQTVEAILAAGMDLIIVGVPPCMDGQNGQDKLNAWLKWYAAEMNLPFVDVFSALVDPTTRAIAAAYSTGDGVHLHAAGAEVAGQLVAGAIGSLYAPIVGWGCGSNADATNIVPNAWGLTDATSDGVPDGWVALGTPTGGTATHTLETVTGWPGKAFCIEQNGNTNARQLYNDTNISSGKFAVGDLMRASIHIRLTGTNEAKVWLALNGSSTGRTQCVLAHIRTATDGVTSTVEFRVPTGCTSITFYMLAGPGTGKAYFGQPTLVNLTALGVATGIE